MASRVGSTRRTGRGSSAASARTRASRQRPLGGARPAASRQRLGHHARRQTPDLELAVTLDAISAGSWTIVARNTLVDAVRIDPANGSIGDVEVHRVANR